MEERVWKEKSGVSETMMASRLGVKEVRRVIMYGVGRSMIIES